MTPMQSTSNNYYSQNQQQQSPQPGFSLLSALRKKETALPKTKNLQYSNNYAPQQATPMLTPQSSYSSYAAPQQPAMIPQQAPVAYSSYSVASSPALAPATAPEYVDPGLLVTNNCPAGYPQLIWESGSVTGTYCRCPDGRYGFTCTENFVNPCDGSGLYFPADPRLSSNFYVQCNWHIPTLLKCPSGLMWNQAILTCDRDPAFFTNYLQNAINQING
jgi:hypothetical protein